MSCARMAEKTGLQEHNIVEVYPRITQDLTINYRYIQYDALIFKTVVLDET